jgi:hypothetical protein
VAMELRLMDTAAATAGVTFTMSVDRIKAG